MIFSKTSCAQSQKRRVRYCVVFIHNNARGGFSTDLLSIHKMWLINGEVDFAKTVFSIPAPQWLYRLVFGEPPAQWLADRNRNRSIRKWLRHLRYRFRWWAYKECLYCSNRLWLTNKWKCAAGKCDKKSLKPKPRFKSLDQA